MAPSLVPRTECDTIPLHTSVMILGVGMGFDVVSATWKDVRALYERRASAIVDSYQETAEHDWTPDQVREFIHCNGITPDKAGFELVLSEIKARALRTAFAGGPMDFAAELVYVAELIRELDATLIDARAARLRVMRAAMKRGYSIDDVARWSGLGVSGAYRVLQLRASASSL